MRVTNPPPVPVSAGTDTGGPNVLPPSVDDATKVHASSSPLLLQMVAPTIGPCGPNATPDDGESFCTLFESMVTAGAVPPTAKKTAALPPAVGDTMYDIPNEPSGAAAIAGGVFAG